MWRGILPGATRMTSKRMSPLACRGMLGEPKLGGGDDAALAAFGDRSTASSSSARALTSTKTRSVPAPRDDVDLAERRFPAPRQDAIALGDEKHARRGFPPRAQAGTPRRAPAAARVSALSAAQRGAPCVGSVLASLLERQRALIDLAARQAGDGGDLADRLLDRNARQRLAQQGIEIGGARSAAPPAAARSRARSRRAARRRA